MKTFISNLFIILFLGLIPCGCENDPTSPPEDHTDADGFVLEDENDAIYGLTDTSNKVTCILIGDKES